MNFFYKEDNFVNKAKIAFIGIIAALMLSGCADTQNSSGNSGAGDSVNSEPSGVIGAKEAEKAAFNHAGLTAEGVTVTKTEYDRDDNEYDIEFTVGEYKYEYDISAEDGAILKFSKIIVSSGTEDVSEKTPPNNAQTTPPKTEKPSVNSDQSTASQPTSDENSSVPAAGRISAEEAKAAALDHAGLSVSDVTFTKVELERDDGREEYDVEFVTSDHEYEYEIAAESGAVLSHSKEALDIRSANPLNGGITSEQAKAAALDHAGLSDSDVTFTKVELERDNGRAEYDVEFVSGDYEYDYKIAAESGMVMSHSKEALSIPTANPAGGSVTLEEAKAAALAHAGFTASDVTFTKTEFDLDDGREEYEIEFIVSGTEYEYTIDAATGKIIEYEAE